jgi:CHAT domain-containing protein
MLESDGSVEAGDYEQAIQQLETAIDQAAAIGDYSSYHLARIRLGEIYRQQGDLPKALAFYQETLAQARQQAEQWPLLRRYEQVMLSGIAAIHLHQGDPNQAIAQLDEALKVYYDYRPWDCIPNPGLGQINPCDMDVTEFQMIMRKGVVQWLNGQLADAEATLRHAADRYDIITETRIRGGVHSPSEYEWAVETNRWLQQVLVDQGKIEEALERSEELRSRSFAALLNSRINPAEDLLPSRFDVENYDQDPYTGNQQFAQQVYDQATIEAPTLAEIKAIARRQNATLVSYTVIYAYDPNRFQFLDFAEIPVTNLLIWVIQPDGEIQFEQVEFRSGDLRFDLENQGNNDLIPILRRARTSIFRGRGKVRPLRRLYDVLIEPIEQYLPADPDAPVIFIPQDLLYLVSFAAIPTPDDRYLIEDYTIAIAPSIQTLALTAQRQDDIGGLGEGALIVGNPTMPNLNGKPLEPLPGAEAEAQKIAQMLQSEALIGSAATENAVVSQISQARLIHLATHGLLDPVNAGFLSSLALAPAPPDDGFLRAREINSLTLNAELVVLSACDTGRGSISGDGVAGLGQSFIAAGTPSILVSLWQIPDAPTASLMVTFYQQLQQGINKAQALRQAMLTTLGEFPAPSNWAAFLLMGQIATSPQLQQVTGLPGGETGAEVGLTGSPTNSPTNSSIDSRYVVFPIPDDIESYQEIPSDTFLGQQDVLFETTLSNEAIFAFYRDAFGQWGLVEERDLFEVYDGDRRFLMVFTGLPAGNVVIHGALLAGPPGTEDLLNVSISLSAF